MSIILYILIIFASAMLITTAIAAGSLATWVPTKKKDLPRIRRLADIKDGESFYDLGSGDGRVAAHIARHTPAYATGIELSFLFYLISMLRKISPGYINLKFKLKSIYNEDLSGASTVFIFPASRRKLKGKLMEKLSKELKHGAKIITYAFPIEGWKEKTIDRPSENDIAIYLYEYNRN